MEVVIASALQALSYIIVAGVSYFGGRKTVGPNQDKLISTLKDLVDAQQLKIASLELGNKFRDEKIAGLEKEIGALKALTIFQAKEIERLSAKRVV